MLLPANSYSVREPVENSEIQHGKVAGTVRQAIKLSDKREVCNAMLPILLALVYEMSQIDDRVSSFDVTDSRAGKRVVNQMTNLDCRLGERYGSTRSNFKFQLAAHILTQIGVTVKVLGS